MIIMIYFTKQNQIPAKLTYHSFTLTLNNIAETIAGKGFQQVYIYLNYTRYHLTFLYTIFGTLAFALKYQCHNRDNKNKMVLETSRLISGPQTNKL